MFLGQHFCPENCRPLQLAPHLRYDRPSGAFGPALNLIPLFHTWISSRVRCGCNDLQYNSSPSLCCCFYTTLLQTFFGRRKKEMLIICLPPLTNSSSNWPAWVKPCAEVKTHKTLSEVESGSTSPQSASSRGCQSCLPAIGCELHNLASHCVGPVMLIMLRSPTAQACWVSRQHRWDSAWISDENTCEAERYMRRKLPSAPPAQSKHSLATKCWV